VSENQTISGRLKPKSIAVCGMSEASMPFLLFSKIALSAACCFFGFTFASAYVLIPRLVELIGGEENFTSAIGLNFFMQGMGLLIGTPFASLIFRVSGR
jgi:hypothetical protein